MQSADFSQDQPMDLCFAVACCALRDGRLLVGDD
jgi:hypothetical protein